MAQDQNKSPFVTDFIFKILAFLVVGLLLGVLMTVAIKPTIIKSIFQKNEGSINWPKKDGGSTKTPKVYTCPTEEWVDCMPTIGDSKPQCENDFLKWAKQNCPNFKGAAL